MYKTKKEVDKHVQVALSNLRPQERDMRGLTVAKLYYKINEYQKAEEYLLAYLSVKEDNDQAYKMLGQCYKHLKKTEKSLQSFQRALQLNPKQPDVLVEVCQLLLDDPSVNLQNANYWCDLAESEKVSHDAVFSLRLKIMDKTEIGGGKPLEELIQKEIAARPHDVSVRISLLRSYVEQQRVEEAFKYAFKLELCQKEPFNSSADWYNVVWHVLSNYELAKCAKKDWDYWLLALVCLERQVSIILNSLTGNVNDATNVLFKFDQYLYTFAQVAAGKEHLHDQLELVAFCQEHYRGQLLLHIVTLLFKREQLQNKNKWKETVRIVLPVLLLGFQIETPDPRQHWLKHCNEQSKQLVQLWSRETAFRAAQLGRIMLSLFEEKENEAAQFNQLVGNEHDGLWENSDELLSLLRQICADNQWRRNVFLAIFTNTEHKLKDSTSIFMTSSKLNEPNYVLPKLAAIEEYEEVAQQLHPQSLAHHVYLCLSNDNLADLRAHYFSGLNYSTENLIFCGVESLSQLDVDSFMYATTIQAKRQLEVEREMFQNYNSGNRNASAKPRVLPYALISAQLCTEEQSNWWHAAYTVYKNLSSHSNLSELRTQLQLGIEAVRGVSGPKANLYIVFKLGQVLLSRAQGLVKAAEKAALEARVELLYKQGLVMLKKHQKNHLEPYGKYFKYAKSNLIAVEYAVNNAAEDAISYLSTRYFKKSLFEEFIEEVDELLLPTATYMQAEAYRRLDEINRTPKKTKCLHLERRSEYLQKTRQLLEKNPGHQLSSLIAGEIQRLHQESNHSVSNKSSNKYRHHQHSINNTYGGLPCDFHNNSSNYEDAEEEIISESNTVSTVALNRSRHDTATTAAIYAAAAAANAPHNLEMENLVKQMATTLGFVKDQIVDSIIPEVLSMRKEVCSLKEKVTELEDTLKKTRIASETPSRDDASQVLDDICQIEDALKNQLYQAQSGPQAQVPSTTPHFPSVFNGAAASGGSPFMPPGPSAQHPHTALQQQASHLQQQRFFSPMSAFNNQMFPASPNALNFYTQPPQYMIPPPQGPGVPPNILGPRNSNFPLNIYAPQAPPFLDPAGALGFNLPQQLAANQLVAQATMAQLLPPPPPAPAPLVNALPTTTTTALAAPTASIIVPSSTALPAGPSQPTISAPAIFNKALNNQPVEKGPPANVVITSSDPLPKAALGSSLITAVQQPTLSVTIPPQHIKPSLVQTNEVAVTTTALTGATSTTSTMASTFSFNLSGNSASAAPANAFMGFGNTPSHTAALAPAGPATVTPIFGNSTFSFKPQIAQAAAEKAKLEQSGGDGGALNKSGHLSDVSKSFGSETEPEYDPRPDFQPIIPLPDEVEVKTGEEDETVMFCYLAKLYRHVANEWKERGKGDIKILKNKEGYSRVLMRREQTHKICANHKITPEMKLCRVDKEEKCYIWVANDFADEELHWEKFFVRFKLPETALKFKTAFEIAKKDAAELDTKQKENDKDTPKMNFALSKSNALNSFATSTPSTNKSEGLSGTVGLLANPTTNPIANIVATTPSVSAAASPAMSKSLFGSIAPAKGDPRKQTTGSATDTSKEPTAVPASPFSNFTFGANTSVTFTPTQPTPAQVFSMFGNLGKGNVPVSPFGVAAGAGGDAGSPFGTPLGLPKAAGADKSTTSEVDEDEYVPTAEFKPVISLPELVEANTGEENERVLFEHRAKLLRFVKETSEWKERGLGNIKLLQANNDVNQVRLLMRREQVFKLCCNQRLLKDTKFSYAKNSRTALTWAGQDYSEETLNTEMLCVRFKTEVICQQFLDAVLKAQTAMCAESAVVAVDKKSEVKQNDLNAKAKENAAAGNETLMKGFGDAFTPKAGSWECNTCYICNEVDQLYCISCESPKDDTVPKKEPTNAFDLTTNVTSKFKFGFGGGGGGDSVAGTTANKPAFMFGPPASSTVAASLGKSTSSNSSSSTSITSQQGAVANTVAAAAAANPIATSTKSGFGDAFKPKAGSWTCQGCYLSNLASVLYCSACETPKDDTVPKKDSNQGVLSLAPSAGAPKFNFGFNTTAVTAPPNAFTFDPNAGDTKSERVKNLFGGNVVGTKSSDTFTFTPPTATSTTLSEATQGQNPVSNAFNFSLPQKPSAEGAQEQYSINKKDFNFTLKPKSPGRGQKAPSKSAGGNDDDDAGDDDYHEEEENNTYFTPVIPLPDKIDVRTGEENEEMLYVHRAKLFRLVDNEWKERGLGDVKILRHSKTHKLRVVMRREQVLKICLNHVLNENVGYKPKDDKSWLFIVHDFSEGESVLERFTLRFKNAEIAKGFINAVKSALDGSAEPIVGGTTAASEQTLPALSNTAVSNPITDEIRLKAEKLMLPYDFLTADGKCGGCRGCDPDAYEFKPPNSLEPFYKPENDGKPPLPMHQPAMRLPSSATVTGAVNRTLIKPGNMLLNTLSTNGSGDAATNTQPLGTTSDGTFSFKAAFESSNKANANETNSTPATGGFVFGGGDKNLVFGQTPSIFAESNVSKSIFGGASNNSDSVNPMKSIFGGSSTGTENKANAIFSSAPSSWSATPTSGGCLFGNSNTGTTKTESSIFGGTASNPASMGGSLFSGALPKQEFGGTSVFGSGKPIFGLGNINTKSDAGDADDNVGKSLFGSKATDDSKISFADLSNASTTTANNTTSSGSLFGLCGEASFGNASFNKSTNVGDGPNKNETAIGFGDLTAKSTTDFSILAAKAASSDDFASLAVKASGNGSGTPKAFQKSPGGFIGLTHQDAFQSFLKPNNANNSPQANAGNNDGGEANDENYDPHYEPIIPLPEEIVVTTGEEDETKLFGERAMLYRYNSDTKEWKERGVGELKILLHPVKQTYRMLMRREQIHKCVLNHAIAADFSFSNMNNNPKSFIWGAMNYAETNTGEVERLAVRFKKQDIGDMFRKTLEECIDAAKKRQNYV